MLMRSYNQREAIKRIEDALEKASQRYNIVLPKPNISFDLSGSVAGNANGGKWTIRLNPHMLDQNGETFLSRTPIHEAAHLIVRKIYGNEHVNGRRVVKPHGREWKGIMRFLGCEPNRCHSYSTENVGKRTRKRGARFIYGCNCRDNIVVGPTRHKRHQRGIKTYYCPHCKSTIRYLFPQ